MAAAAEPAAGKEVADIEVVVAEGMVELEAAGN